MGDSRRENARLSVKWRVFVVKMRGFHVIAGILEEKMHDLEVKWGISKRNCTTFWLNGGFSKRRCVILVDM